MNVSLVSPRKNMPARHTREGEGRSGVPRSTTIYGPAREAGQGCIRAFVMAENPLCWPFPRVLVRQSMSTNQGAAGDSTRPPPAEREESTPTPTGHGAHPDSELTRKSTMLPM